MALLDFRYRVDNLWYWQNLVYSSQMKLEFEAPTFEELREMVIQTAIKMVLIDPKEPKPQKKGPLATPKDPNLKDL